MSRRFGSTMGARIRLGSVTDIPDNDFRVFNLEAIDVVVYRIENRFYAVSPLCPHAGVNLARGPLDRTVVTCPGHGLRFDVTTGRCLDRDDLMLTRFSVVADGGEVYVEF